MSQEMNRALYQGIHWVSSAHQGQVIYPIYLENAGLVSRDLLKLGRGPGDLIFNGIRHNLVAIYSVGYSMTIIYHEQAPVDGPKSLLPNKKLEWYITKCEGYLELGMGVTSTSIKMFNPMKVI